MKACNPIAPVWAGELEAWITATRDLATALNQTESMAAALGTHLKTWDTGGKCKAGCWTCGDQVHFAHQCPNKIQDRTEKHPPSICPRCKKIKK